MAQDLVVLGYNGNSFKSEIGGSMGRILVLAILCLSGCSGRSMFESVDDFAFEKTGGTIFSDPSQITTKELHFDNGDLLGREVIVEGKIQSTGNHYTYLVISDESGRMLVVLTHLDEAEDLLKDGKPKAIKVLGTLERGKKGLPYILARSINPVEKPLKS